MQLSQIDRVTKSNAIELARELVRGVSNTEPFQSDVNQLKRFEMIHNVSGEAFSAIRLGETDLARLMLIETAARATNELARMIAVKKATSGGEDR